ncbi:MAG: hypothetical protein ACLFP2_04885 [Candidatus Woesearchaeota archaeon]
MENDKDVKNVIAQVDYQLKSILKDISDKIGKYRKQLDVEVRNIDNHMKYWPETTTLRSNLNTLYRNIKDLENSLEKGKKTKKISHEKLDIAQAKTRMIITNLSQVIDKLPDKKQTIGAEQFRTDFNNLVTEKTKDLNKALKEVYDEISNEHMVMEHIQQMLKQAFG